MYADLLKLWGFDKEMKILIYLWKKEFDLTSLSESAFSYCRQHYTRNNFIFSGHGTPRSFLLQLIAVVFIICFVSVFIFSFTN